MKEENHKVMKITVTQEFNISKCNDCPYFVEEVDTSSCIDTFDEPNFDWYCKHKEATNYEYPVLSKYNKPGLKCLGGSMHRNTDCEIPDWCPFKK